MKKRLTILCILLTASLSMAAYGMLSKQQIPSVAVMYPIRKTLNSKIHCVGTLESPNTDYVTPSAGEIVIKLVKHSGDRVSKGDLLFKTHSNDGEKCYNAPISGVIGRSTLKEQGEAIPGISFLQIISTDELVVTAELDEIYLSDVQYGQNVELYLGAYPDRKYSGKISDITPYATVSGGLLGMALGQGKPAITLQIAVSGDTSDLIPGLSASGDIITKTETDALLVPSSSVFMDGEEEYLFCYQDGTAHKIRVKTGLYYDGYYQILEGLSSCDTVILDPDDTITDGMKVMPHA